MKYLVALTILLSAAVCRADSPFSWTRTDGSLALEHNQQIVWQFNYDKQLTKPHFHPLNLPGGKTLTWRSPPDHPWHYGMWFSWKYINGVNYWEEDRQTHTSQGRTSLHKIVVTPHTDHSAKFELELNYQGTDQSTVLSENRIIHVSQPRGDGGYTIDWDATFTAQAEQVTLDRTPLPNEPGGEVFGGYAGLSLRLAQEAADFRATSSDQEFDQQPERMRFRASQVDYSGSIDGIEGGITIVDDPANINSPTPWYVIRNTKTPLTFFSPAVIQQSPMNLSRGDSFRLHYQIIVHPGPNKLKPLAAKPIRETKKSQRVLYFTRNVGYYHSVVKRTGDALSHSERALVDMCKPAGIEVTCTKDGRVFDESLDGYDAIAFFTNNDLTTPNPEQEPPMSAEGKQRLLDAVAAGKGFIAFHSSCACWRTPPTKDDQPAQIDPFLQMLGGEFISHGAQQQATMLVTSPNFPGIAKLAPKFSMVEEWYALKNFAPDLHVILLQETEGMQGQMYQRPPYPSTWARRHGKGRVFFTSLAHRENVWVEEPFQQIVLGGLAWVLGNVDVDVTPNLHTVMPPVGEATGTSK